MKDWAANASPLNSPQGAHRAGQGQGRLRQAPAGSGKKVSMARSDRVGRKCRDRAGGGTKTAGRTIEVPFTPEVGLDADAAQTDAASIAVLEPKADGFRNGNSASAAWPLALVQLAWSTRRPGVGPTVPEMADCRVGGLRASGGNAAEC